MNHPVKETTSESYYALVCGFNELANFFIIVGKTLSIRADEHGDFDAMQLLLEHGAGLGMHSYFESLACLIMPGRREAVQLLLPHNSNVDARNRHGTNRTSLHFASINGRLKVARPSWIIELMSICLASPSPRPSPLYEALRHGSFEVGSVLFAYGADVSIRREGNSDHIPDGNPRVVVMSESRNCY